MKLTKGIQSVETAYRILVAIQVGPEPVALKDIAARAQVTPSQAHNYLTSFVRTGMVSAVGRGQYQLGASLAALGMSAMRNLDHYSLVQEEAVELQGRTSLGVAVSIWGELGPIIVFNKPGKPWGQFDLRNGLASTVWTGGGNIFIAYLPDRVGEKPAVEELVADGISENEAIETVTEIAIRVRRDGYAYQTLKEMPTYAALSVPIWDQHSTVRYALTLTGPRERIDADPAGAHIPKIRESGNRLSQQFGAPSSHWSQ